MIRHCLDKLHRLTSGSEFIVQIVLLIRNQCNSIIKYYLAEDANPKKNGEKMFVSYIADFVESFIDVGANKGEYAAMLLDESSKIKSTLLFEPSSNCYLNLTQKFVSYKNVEIIRAAVSDQPGKVTFYEEEKAGETSSLISKFSSPGAKETLVDATTLDYELKKREVRQVDFLKIDTEGYDFHVLKGSKEALKNNYIKIVQFEYNTPWAYAGSTLFEAIKFLKTYNYETYLLKKKGLYIFDYEKYGEFYTYANFVSISPDYQNRMKDLIKGKI